MWVLRNAADGVIFWTEGRVLDSVDHSTRGLRMNTTATADPSTALNPAVECRLCGKQNAMDATHCKGCGNEFAEVTLSDTSRGQRIKNFNAWQQVSVRAPTTVDIEPPRAPWLYLIGGVAVASLCIAVLAFILYRLPV
jgi:hypothetical protein